MARYEYRMVRIEGGGLHGAGRNGWKAVGIEHGYALMVRRGPLWRGWRHMLGRSAE